MSTLQIIWFFVIAALLVGYTILDGYDLGVGIWSLFTRKAEEKTAFLRAIGPFWDGNEVWLITAGAALFAAFPPVYATIFSGFYLAMMLVVLLLIGRAVAIEYRGSVSSPGARGNLGLVFGVCSLLLALLFGVAFGNILRGLPLDAQGNYTGTFFDLLNPFALLVGVLNVTLLATHGAAFLAMRTRDDLVERARLWTIGAASILVPLTLLTMLIVVFSQPHLLTNFQRLPVLWAVPLVALLAMVLAPIIAARGQDTLAFASSSVGITALLASAVVALFPVMVPALGDPSRDLTAANASSTPLTLGAMLVIVGLGMPVIIGCVIWVHKVFGGPVETEGEGY